MTQVIKKTLFIVVVFYCIVLLGLYLFQERMLFQSVKLKAQYQFNFSKQFSEINLKTDDDAQLNGLYFEVTKPKGVILYFHGNKDNLVRWGDIASELTQYNYNVLVVDYRGYGKSTGTRSETKLYQDTQEWYNYLKTTFKETGIVVYGRSLGSTFATYVASKNKPQQLILEAPFNSLADVPRYWFKYAPYNLLLKYKFNSQAYIKSVNCKTTLFHGTKDKVIPFKLGRKLFKAAPKNKAIFIEIKGGKHNNLGSFELYWKTIEKLLN
jgi:uncharacterized protein